MEEVQHPTEQGVRVRTHASRFIVIVSLCAAALLAAPATSGAALGLAGFSVAPADPAAAVHSDVTVAIAFSDPSDNAKSLSLDLPPGLLGDPNATPRCGAAALQADACPAASAVGSTTVMATALGVTVPASGTVYNVAPQPNEAARLGIVVRPAGGLLGTSILESSVTVRDASDYGLTSSLTDLPTSVSGIPIDIVSLSLTLNGTAASGKPFMSNPTSCVPATAKVRVVSESGAVARGVSGFTPTACGAVPFSPALATSTSDARTEVAAAIETRLTLPGDAGGRVQAHVRRAVVTLPDGVGFSPGLAPGLRLCSVRRFGIGSDAPEACPAASRIGDVEFDTPLLGTLKGSVYFSRDPAHPFRIFVAAALGSVRVKLIGEVTPDPATGRLTTVFDNLPQVPFTRFALTFQGGPRAVLTTPPSCGTDPARAALAPWSGRPAVTPAAPPLAVSYDGAGRCSVPFRPAVQGTTSTRRAGKSTTTTITFTRPSRDQRLRRIYTKLPAGLLGRIASVPFCTGRAARTGACPSRTRLGSVRTTVGSAGAVPVTLPGTVYLGPSAFGSLASLIIVTPAKVGPVDQGTLVLRAPLSLGERDARVGVAATIPRAFGGIPLAVRRLSLTIDRKGFMVNPTGCGKRSFDAIVGSTRGRTTGARDSFRVRDCDDLRFKPRLRISGKQKGPITPGDSPTISVKLKKSTKGVGLFRAGVVFPKTLQPRVNLLRDVCSTKQYRAGRCPKSSRVGTAVARTPLLPVPLKGSVYLAITGKEIKRKVSGINLPSAVVFLEAPGKGPRGTVRLRVESTLRLKHEAGRLEGSFYGLPDVPLKSFDLRFRGGKKGVFLVVTDPCRKKADRATSSLLGHDRRLVRRDVRVKISGCKRGFEPGPAPDNSAGS